MRTSFGSPRDITLSSRPLAQRAAPIFAKVLLESIMIKLQMLTDWSCSAPRLSSGHERSSVAEVIGTFKLLRGLIP
jgi:hypothetical protein